MAEQTRRELLEAAWDKTENEDDDDDIATLSGDEALDDSAGRVGAGDEGDVGVGEGEEIPDAEKPVGEETSGKTAKKGKEVGKKPAVDETQRKEAEAARRDEGTAPAEGEAQPVTGKAPQSWKPAAREHWGKIPAEARAEISRRELQVQQTLSQTAQVRKFAGDFAQTINPFAHLIRAQHSTPLAAVKNLMETAAGLMQGNARQKASIVAEIIANYAVDPQELDAVLVELVTKNGGKMPSGPQGRPVEQIPSWAQPILQTMETVKQQREESLRQNADVEIAKISSLPFYEDVADDIADVMEIAARRGISMTTKQAYDKAIQLNPEVSKVVAQRRRAADAAKANKGMTRARRAASSVSGGPSGKAAGSSSAGGDKPTRRQQLSEAWDEAT